MANAGFAALWIWSRTAGEPFGPNAGEPEAVQAAGICALLLECYIVMGAAWAWFRGDRAEPVSGFGSALVMLGANTVVVAAVTAGWLQVFKGMTTTTRRTRPKANTRPRIASTQTATTTIRSLPFRWMSL